MGYADELIESVQHQFRSLGQPMGQPSTSRDRGHQYPADMAGHHPNSDSSEPSRILRSGSRKLKEKENSLGAEMSTQLIVPDAGKRNREVEHYPLEGNPVEIPVGPSGGGEEFGSRGVVKRSGGTRSKPNTESYAETSDHINSFVGHDSPTATIQDQKQEAQQFLHESCVGGEGQNCGILLPPTEELSRARDVKDEVHNRRREHNNHASEAPMRRNLSYREERNMEPSSSNARKSRSTEKSIRHKYEDACADLFGAEQKIREKRKKIQELRDRCKAIDSKLRQSEELVQQLYQEGEKWQEQQSADSKRQHEKFNKFLKAKDKEIQNQGAIIAQLSAEMAHLNNQRPESKQDDEYFASKFSNLARSVQSWVFRHFNTSGAIQQPTDFSGDLRITLEKISPDWEDLIRRQKIKVVQAMIVDIIVQYIWGPFLIGMVNEGSDAFRLYQQLEQSYETRAKWRKMTVDAILTTPEYKSGQQATIENIASTLSKLLAPLASPTSKDTARIRSLIPLLAEAAEILIQCRKEPSEFCWQRPTPRTPCQASYMEDAEGIFDDEELEKSGALVELLVFPLVLRRAEDGELVVISKAQVLTFPVKVAAAIEPTSGGSNSMDLDMGAGV